MGFSSQAIILGLIRQIYTIDFQINRLYQDKFRMQKFAQQVSVGEAHTHGTRGPQLLRRRDIVFGPDGPRFATTTPSNRWSDPDRALRESGGMGPFRPPTVVFDPFSDPDSPQVPLRTASRLVDGRLTLCNPSTDESFVREGEVALDERGNRLGDGERLVTPEEAKALSESDRRGLNAEEAKIDQQLEILKAQRTALNAQRDEFQKYVAEGIKNTFKNNYA